MGVVNRDIENKKKIEDNYFQNALGLFNVLPNVTFTTSETKRDNYL